MLCPKCGCCGQSVRVCAHAWEEMLGVGQGSITHYLEVKGLVVGLGCGMEALLASAKARYYTDCSLYWAHVTEILGLLKAPEVAKYVGMGGRMKPRQETERRFASICLSKEEALQELVKAKAFRANIYALSYSRHAKEHPDPTGTTASRVVEGLSRSVCGDWVKGPFEEGRSLFSKRRGGKRERRKGEDDAETWMEETFRRQNAVILPETTTGYPLMFQDFSSLPQWPRTDEEDALFKKGLSLLACLYGNASENVYFLRCTEVPADLQEVTNKTPYHERGWTNFESRVSSVKQQTSIVQLGPLPQNWVQIPLSPPGFHLLLMEKKKSAWEPQEESGQDDLFTVKFTNGRTDRQLVSELYRSFVLDTQVRGQRTINMYEKYKIDTREKGEMVGEYFRWIGEQPECEIESVSLWNCHLTNASLPPLASGLCALSKLRDLKLWGNKFGPSSLSALSSLSQLKTLKLPDTFGHTRHAQGDFGRCPELRELRAALPASCEILAMGRAVDTEAVDAETDVGAKAAVKESREENKGVKAKALVKTDGAVTTDADGTADECRCTCCVM
uniref:Uncharacterized protein n=2 Tax=Chromera velia CCMP2878 TaxID=1169474 RepID=A0A0G4HKV4_9ALVE|eukprot:Cvel_28725.t1-p1 / transcript=Cvel_28725.t1 / gene=Cvel_28725 / organism=Chromera_velia_CCMP2878 / gene_product=hypothetical protein / transcript_product=hypothetical protein / location=Cvel_scaffold3813:6015-8060(-) / protein_length=559 / sequence_SO=supercontig / SO=protein_coding / is_pseudo=false